MKKNLVIKGLFIIIVIQVLVVLVNPFGSANYVDDKVVLLNLDDRPANEYVPGLLANIGGVQIDKMPEELLEKVAPKENGFDPALMEEMQEFLLLREDADAFIISADMLFFGGLVSSRSVELESEKRGIERVEKGIEILKSIKAEFPDTPIYLYSTIQRLAPTLAGDVGEDEYHDLRYYAIFYDRAMNEGQQDYQSSLERIESRLPQELLEDYLNSRQVNQEINLEMIQLLQEDYIDHLIISQDDAADYGLHRDEQRELETKVENLDLESKVNIFPGTDEVDGILISRYINKTYDREPGFYPIYPQVPDRIEENLEPRYYAPDKWVPLLEDMPVQENFEAHVKAMGGEVVDERLKADVFMYINTLNCGCGEDSEDIVKRVVDRLELDDEQEKQLREEVRAQIEEFVGEIKAALEAGQNVAVADVGRLNGSCDTFARSLVEEIEVLELMSYSGWNTAGNSIGQSLAQASNRHFFLGAGSFAGETAETTEKNDGEEKIYELDDKTELAGARAQANMIFHRLVKDHIYANKIREETKDYLKTWDGNRHELEDDYERALSYLDVELRNEAVDFYLDHFSGKRIVSKASPCDCCQGFGLGLAAEDVEDHEAKTEHYVIRGLASFDIDLPWKRLFEVSIRSDFSLELED